MDLDVGVKRWGIVGAIATATTVLLAAIGLVFRGGSDVGQIKDRQQAAVRKLDTIQSEQRNLRKRLRVLELRDAQRGVQRSLVLHQHPREEGPAASRRG